ncbi:MAG: hypothetical protein AAB361_02710 [Patescibacteria group bacterium]
MTPASLLELSIIFLLEDYVYFYADSFHFAEKRKLLGKVIVQEKRKFQLSAKKALG